MSEKVILEAHLIFKKLHQSQIKEIASKLQLPDNKQQDLLFMSAILVSTGTNKNGATFLGSELIKARETISQKALDIEHDEQKIIGHIASAMYMDHDGAVIDDQALHLELASTEKSKAQDIIKKLDTMEMDIGIVCIVYKDRFPDLAKEIEAGDWKVSMECYYDDFDLKIGNLIVPRALAATHEALDKRTKEKVKLVLSGKEEGDSKVSRVLRNIKFCGVGIVKNPANERSLILEAASNNLKETLEKEEVFSYQEAANSGLENEPDVVKYELESLKNEVVQLKSSGFYLVKVTGDTLEVIKDSFNSDYIEISKEAIKQASVDKSNKYIIVAADSLFLPREKTDINITSNVTTYTTDLKGNVEEIHSFGPADKENSHIASKWGPADSSTGICINFKKYKTEFPGNANPGRIIATHWCQLFNKACPVLGADAHDASCLRNKFSRLVKEEDIFGGALVDVPFNPRVPVESVTNIPSEDMPHPKTTEEILANKPEEGTPKGPELIKRTDPIETQAFPEVKGTTVTNPNNIPPQPIQVPKTVTIINPIKDFPVQLASISIEERKSLADEQFGLPSDRKIPLHNEDAIKHAMAYFDALILPFTIKQKKDVFTNIIKRAVLAGLNTEYFEKSALKQGFKYTLATSEPMGDFGIPRLKLFPLDSREQVLSAMSRYAFLKAEITDYERQHLVVNILRAANKFGINSNNFRTRVAKP